MDAMINRILGEQRKNPRLMNPLVLAYIGDTVYDLYVRSWLIEGSDATAHGLHVMAARKGLRQGPGGRGLGDNGTSSRRTSCTYSSGGATAIWVPYPNTRKCRITGRPQALRRCWGTCFCPARTAAYASLWTI